MRVGIRKAKIRKYIACAILYDAIVLFAHTIAHFRKS